MLTPHRILSIAGACGAMTPFAMFGFAGLVPLAEKRKPLLDIDRRGGTSIALSSLPPALYAYIRTPHIFDKSGGNLLALTNPGKLALEMTVKLVPQCVAVFCASVFVTLFYKHALRWPQQNFERRRETHIFGQPLAAGQTPIYWPRYEGVREGLLAHAGFVGALAFTTATSFVVSAPLTLPCGWLWMRGAIAVLRWRRTY